MASPDAPLVRAVTWYLPWLAPFADLASGSPEWHDLERRLPPLRLRLGVEVRISNSGLLCQVPVGPPYPFATVPAGTILRFAKLSHGTEEASSWMGPPAPVFAVEDGPAAGSCLAFYLEWLRAEDVDLGAAIEVISESSLGRA
jgi:hypothetical protein